MSFARLKVTCTSLRDTIGQYNSRIKRIFPVRCGGFDHEYHTFWATYHRERAAELESLPTEELLEMASTIDERERRQITTEAEATDGSNSSRYYHTRLSRNPSSRVNYNER